MPDPVVVDVEPKISADEILSGQAALDALNEQIDKVDVSQARTPRASRAGMVRQLLLFLALIEQDKDMILEELSHKRGRAFKDAVARLPKLCRAILYAQVRHGAALREGDHVIEQERYIDVVKRWRQPSLKLITTLEMLGYVKAKVATHLRTGTSYVDIANDAIEMTTIFNDNWELVEPLQAMQSDPALRITREALAEQQEAALRYLETRDAADANMPLEARHKAWADKVSALHILIEQDWDEIRFAAEYAFKVQRRDPSTWADLHSANGLLRSAEP